MIRWKPVHRALWSVVLAFGVVLAAGASRAQSREATPPAPALWVVRDPDSTIYLFGTIHFMRRDVEWRTPRVETALAASQSLVLEVADPDDRTTVAPLIQQYGVSPDRPLSSLLTPAEFEQLDAAARTVGASGAQMDALRPWLAGVMLSSAIPARGGYDAASGVDMVLRAEAGRIGLPISGLETPQDQVGMLAGFPEEGQLAFLRNTLDNFDQAPVELGQLADAWTRGDVEGIAAITLLPLKARSQSLHEILIVARNQRWAAQIETMLEGSGTVFVAVGALHLAGDQSVQSLLSRDGVEVIRLQ